MSSGAATSFAWAEATTNKHVFLCRSCLKTLKLFAHRDFVRHETSKIHRKKGGDGNTDSSDSVSEQRQAECAAGQRVDRPMVDRDSDSAPERGTSPFSPRISIPDSEDPLLESPSWSPVPLSALSSHPSQWLNDSSLNGSSQAGEMQTAPALEFDDLPYKERQGIVKPAGRNPAKPFESGLDLRLTLVRCSLAIVFSRPQFQLLYDLVMYAKQHLEDHLSSFDSHWSRPHERIPESINPMVHVTTIETTQGQKDLHHIDLPSVMTHVLGSPVLSPLLGILPEINTKGGIKNQRQGAKYHTNPYCQVVNTRRSDGTLLWVGDFHDSWSDGEYQGIVQVVQFLELDAGALVARSRRVLSNDHGVTFFVDISQTFDLLVDNLSYVRVPFTSSAPRHLRERHKSFHIVGCADVDQRSGSLCLAVVHETDLIRMFVTPHPLREKCGDKRHVVMPRTIFSDEFSGSRSKRFDYYENFSVTFPGLGYDVNNRLAHQFFVSTARPPIEVLQMAEAHQRKSGMVAEEGFFAWSEAFQEEVFATSHIFHVSADNPRMNKVTATRKTCRKKFCRNCLGDAETGWLVGPRRSKEEMMQILQESRMIRASKPTRGKLRPNAMRAGKGNADRHLKAVGLVDDREDGNVLNNVFLEAPGYDPYLDSDAEILHWDLGLPKRNFLDGRQFLISDESKLQLEAVFESLNQQGLPHRITGRRSSRHVGSMAGKDFKLMSQLKPIIKNIKRHFDNLSAPHLSTDPFSASHVGFFKNCKLRSRLIVLIHQSEIANLDLYLAELELATAALIQTLHVYSPNRFKLIKVHQILHFPDFIRRFGPLIGNSTEKGEQLNGRVRLHLSHTNRQSPGRDVTTKFARAYALTYMLQGGSWMCDDGTRVVLEPQLLAVGTDPVFKTVFGLVDADDLDNSSRSGVGVFRASYAGSLVQKFSHLISPTNFLKQIQQSSATPPNFRSIVGEALEGTHDISGFFANGATYSGVYARSGELLHNGWDFEVSGTPMICQIELIIRLWVRGLFLDVILCRPFATLASRDIIGNRQLQLRTDEICVVFTDQVERSVNLQHDCLRAAVHTSDAEPSSFSNSGYPTYHSSKLSIMDSQHSGSHLDPAGSQYGPGTIRSRTPFPPNSPFGSPSTHYDTSLFPPPNDLNQFLNEPFQQGSFGDLSSQYNFNQPMPSYPSPPSPHIAQQRTLTQTSNRTPIMPNLQSQSHMGAAGARPPSRASLTSYRAVSEPPSAPSPDKI
ncbi:hypothetical protein HDU93_007879 [Gonapodya sp. JEL0774]|nr:hypothetical protein HDU93_007879 [Gonapodya sp. JEL0774]